MNKTVRRKVVLIVAVCVALIGYWHQTEEKVAVPPAKVVHNASKEGARNERIHKPSADRTPTGEDAASERRHGSERDERTERRGAPTIGPRMGPPVGDERETSRSNDDARESAGDRNKVPDVVVRDQSGEVVFEGTVDLQPTLDRIQARERLPYQHDGAVFHNREGRLPKKPNNYYFEYVHPTPRLSGPGPQRVIVGKNGEIYYTSDHYRTFQRIR